jgi:hypothetical protein
MIPAVEGHDVYQRAQWERRDEMKKVVLVLAALIFGSPLARTQENTFRINVLAYQWTTTHNTLNFSWPGHANTSCNGSIDMTGYASGSGNISASGTTSNNCSTSYAPPSNQTIDIQKPVLFLLADSETSRMVMSCTRNVRWSQCKALNPGQFVARIDNGHFEVQAVFTKGKEEWVKYEIVQQTAISKQESTPAPAATQEAHASIDAPESQVPSANSGFPNRWKSMTSGSIRVLRFEGDYIYGEAVLSEAAAKAGSFHLMEVKKDGDKFVGKANGRVVQEGGSASCPTTSSVELTLVTRNRIEGRAFAPPRDAKIDWKACTYSPPPDWQSFVWIPVK